MPPDIFDILFLLPLMFFLHCIISAFIGDLFSVSKKIIICKF